MPTTTARTKSLILSAVIEHMPETAAASGLCSQVDLTPWLADMSARFPLEARPANHGLTALTEWLKSRCVEAGPRAVKALRADWIRDELRAAADAEYAVRYGVEALAATKARCGNGN